MRLTLRLSCTIRACTVSTVPKPQPAFQRHRTFSIMHRAPAAMVTRPEPANVTINPPRDPNTLSNYNNFKTTHTALDLKVDFAKKLLAGDVTLSLVSLTDGESDEVILDSSFLKVSDIKVDGKSVKYAIGKRVEPYGNPISIALGNKPKKDETLDVSISVSTTEQCTALQWMTPAQTSNGKHPYMFSQCQAIHARSVFPCQDTPDVKSTFDFRIHSPLPVLCSGLLQEGTQAKDVYLFKQKVPIPSYLFAIASGDIEGASIGPRSMVWTGPDELKGAQWELEADTEAYLQTAEKIVFPYEWGTYNVLVLPPSFPYGGMENPVYTFATPTIISGDRQNVDVIAHELSHSWSGNLVSPASWEHFWLNEGWTTYLERRIQGAIHGEAHRDFSAIIGWKGLQDTIEQFGEDSPLTALVPDLKGKDPDDAFSQIPYEKGSTFILFLERLIGREKFDKFIPHYFETYKYKSLDSYDFHSTLTSFYAKDAAATEKIESIDWDTWLYKPGFPPKPDFDTSLVDACYALADKWEALTTGKAAGFEPAAHDIHGWVANQTVVFLERVQLFKKPLTPEQVHLMGTAYGLAKSNNVELVSRFFVVGLKAKDMELLQPVAELLGRVGRMKFVRPLFRHLKEVDRDFAVKVFEKNKDFYHPICRGMVEKDLFGESKKSS